MEITLTPIRNGLASRCAHHFCSIHSVLHHVKRRTIAKARSFRYDDDLSFRVVYKGNTYFLRYLIDDDKFLTYSSSTPGGICSNALSYNSVLSFLNPKKPNTL